MSVNFSSPTNSSLSSDQVACELSVLNLSIVSSIDFIRALLLLPLSILILCLGAQRWREKRSIATESHCDIFTYHVAILELIWVLCLVCFYYDVFTGENLEMSTLSRFMFNLTWYGEDLFHVLTCAERYLAVVHPITYMLQKNGRGVRIRNISIGCAWLLSVFFSIIINIYNSSFSFFYLPTLLISVAVVSYFSFSVLRVLNHPGPVEGGRNKVQANQVKQRAFFTILAVTGVQWLWFFGLILSYALYSSPLLSPDVSCVAVAGAVSLNLPSSLVLPLLYLQRAGKLMFCFRNTRENES